MYVCMCHQSQIAAGSLFQVDNFAEDRLFQESPEVKDKVLHIILNS